MHMQGTPETMQLNPTYADVTRELAEYFEARLQALKEAGIASEQIVLDPGIGFGKTANHNLELIARLDEFCTLGRPICLGVSRKGFFGKVLGRSIQDRLSASLAAACYSVARNAAHVIRVHDVAATHDAIRLFHVLDSFRCGSLPLTRGRS
jgi:dihydropteroate synthase